jgi:hypothetical protein
MKVSFLIFKICDLIKETPVVYQGGDRGQD